MIILKIIGIIAIVIAVLFILSLFIYFFNYNWSKNRREADKKNK